MYAMIIGMSWPISVIAPPVLGALLAKETREASPIQIESQVDGENR
jgi:hypothetical protein